MLLVHFLFALAVTLIVALILAVGLRRRPWSEVIPFLVIIFLTSWAGGIWLDPFGPGLWGGFFFPFLVAGLFFALIIVAALLRPSSRQTVHLETRQEHKAAQRHPRSMWGIFFWSLVIAMIIVIVARYLAMLDPGV